jgi:hypothetical protein
LDATPGGARFSVNSCVRKCMVPACSPSSFCLSPPHLSLVEPQLHLHIICCCPLRDILPYQFQVELGCFGGLSPGFNSTDTQACNQQYKPENVITTSSLCHPPVPV